MLCVAVDSAGFVRLMDSVESSCAVNQYVLVSASEYAQFVQPVFDPALATQAFGIGFTAVVIVGYFGAFPAGIVKTLIAKL